MDKLEKELLKLQGKWIEKSEWKKIKDQKKINSWVEDLRTDNLFLDKEELKLYNQWEKENNIKYSIDKDLIREFRIDYMKELKEIRHGKN